MAFEEIKPIPKAKEFLDTAIRKSNKKASLKKLPKQTRFEKIKSLEVFKIEAFRAILVDRLRAIELPKAVELTEFYLELLEITVGREEYVKAKGKIDWACTKINELFKLYNRKIKNAQEMPTIYKFKNQFYGRTASVMKNLNKYLIFLEQSRRVMTSFPVIKTKMQKIAIAGFPNVGKTTLLKKLSGSKAEVASYAFTTKKTMVGYIGNTQLLDTPGTLNREEKMNYIEKQSYLIMRKVAEKIIYVFDITEPYPLKDQEKLFKRISKYGKPMLVYLSKTDVIDKKEAEEFKEKYNYLDIKELKKEF